MAMLTYRKVVVIALIISIIFLLVRHARESGSTKPPTSGASTQTPGQNHDRQPNSGVFSSDFRRRQKSSKAQNSLDNLSRKPLRAQLAYRFPYELASKFPAYIWQTWKTTPAYAEFPDNWRLFEDSWSQLHPSYIHTVVSDSAAEHMLHHLYSGIPAVIHAYTALPKAVLKADFFRYLILLARGGIYTDMDTTAIKPAMDWVPEKVPRSSFGLVIGIEADPDREDWKDWYSRRIQFCQWTIQAKPGHPALLEIVARITEETLARERAGTLSTYNSAEVIEFTGPAAWTDAVFDFFNDKTYFDMSNSKENITWKQFTGMMEQKKVGDVIVLPITSFSPGVRQMGAGEDDDRMAFVKHLFDGTWKPTEERWIGDPERDKKLGHKIIGHA